MVGKVARGWIIASVLAITALGGAWLVTGHLSTTPQPRARSQPPPVGQPAPEWAYEALSDWPDSPQPKVLYVVTPAGATAAEAALLLCPCGCGDEIRVSLRAADEPHWSFSTDEAGHPSLQPSVWRLSGCQSHFTLHGGRLALFPIEVAPAD